MKSIIKYIIPIFVLLALGVAEVNAQYGYNNGYNNGYNRRGSGIPRIEEPQRKPENLTADEIIDREMPKIVEALELNSFEEAVVSSILTKYVQQTIELQILKLPPEKHREAMDKIRENQAAELKAGLPEEKFDQLAELQRQGYSKMKKKKKKDKKKKNKDESQ